MSDSRPLKPWQLSWMLLLTGVITTLAWLDSLDRYASARFHLSLEALLPAELFVPSRVWHPLLVQPDAREAPEPSPEPEPERPQAARVSEPTLPSQRPAAAPVPADPLWFDEAQPLAPGEFLPSVATQQLAPGPQRVLFAGDSMMQGVAPLVIRELSQRHPDWTMEDLSRQSTGLTVKRYFDWPATILAETQAKKLTLVVIFLGPNDPWDLYEPGRRIAFPSPEWEQRYAQRVDEVLAQATQRDVRVVWVGLPSMAEGRVHTGAVIQNRVFHQRALARHTDYLSTEALLGPLSQPFRKFQEEPGAQPLNLRGGDGIHFSAAGLHKIKQALLDHLERALPP